MLRRIGLYTIEVIICLILSYIAYNVKAVTDMKFIFGGIAGSICTFIEIYLNDK
jgi:hypothetical protein